MSTCSYCFGNHTTILGDIYCSESHAHYDQLGNGLFVLTNDSLPETNLHTARASMRFNLKRDQHYSIDQRNITVTRNSFLVLNSGTKYRTSYGLGEEKSKMVTVEFSDAFLGGLCSALTKSHRQLIDEPFDVRSIQFAESIFPIDETIGRYIHEIAYPRTGTIAGNMHEQLGESLIALYYKISSEMQNLTFTKDSTRIEIYRRLRIAKAYMHENYGSELSIEEIAREACLSKHHFKRLFKQLYKISPHQYLTQIRIDQARHLLRNSSLSVNEICCSIGFQNTSSFIRLFRNIVGSTPIHFRTGLRTL